MPALLGGAIELFGGAEGLGALFGGGAAAAEGGAVLGADALGAATTGAIGGAELGGAAAGGLGGVDIAGLLGEGGAGVASLAEGGSGPGPVLTGGGGAAPTAGPLPASGTSPFDLPTGTAAGGDASFPASGSGAPAAGTPSNTSLFDKLTSAVTNNPLQAAGVGVGGAALGYNVLNGLKTSPEQKSLAASAANLTAQGQQLQSYLTSGTLPAGLQAQVTQANAAAKARVIANHAQNGMPTDPSQNSALAQELASIDQQSIAQVADIGGKLLTTGINETGLADNLYAQLIGINKDQAKSTGLAISNFAAALAGRPTPTTTTQRVAV